MSDFGEVCPLFSTGVFHEVTFPKVVLTHLSLCANALAGTATATSVTARKSFTFGRTVMVTGGLVKVRTKPAAAQSIWLNHMSTITACHTTFGTMMISTSTDAIEANKGWQAVTIITEKTFTASDILMVSVGTVTEDNSGVYDIIVQYKEK